MHVLLQPVTSEVTLDVTVTSESSLSEKDALSRWTRIHRCIFPEHKSKCETLTAHLPVITLIVTVTLIANGGGGFHTVVLS